jgi:hypothetical protein
VSIRISRFSWFKNSEPSACDAVLDRRNGALDSQLDHSGQGLPLGGRAGRLPNFATVREPVIPGRAKLGRVQLRRNLDHNRGFAALVPWIYFGGFGSQ